MSNTPEEISNTPNEYTDPIPKKNTTLNIDSLLSALLLLGTLGLFVVFAWPFFQGRLYVEDDLAALYLPVRDFYAKCLRQGYNFLWMPHLANGFYIHGEGHGGFLHPLHYFLYRVFPLNQAFMLELLLSYPVMWLGTYTFLRRWKLAHSASLFGALLMTFIGCSMNHYVHISFIAVMAHLPWALVAIDVVMKSKSPSRRSLALGACILLSASQLYIGNPQVTYFSWLIEMFYALLLLGWTRRIGGLFHLGVTKVLALAIGAAQLLPTLATYQSSLRQDPGLDYQLGISLHPWNLLQMLSPYLFHGRVYAPLSGDEPWDAPYLGAAMLPLLLLLFLVPIARKGPPADEAAGKGLGLPSGARVLTFAAVALAVFALLAMLGKYGFIYHGLTRIPVVNFFRAPARYVTVLHVALAILGAVSFSVLMRIVVSQSLLSWKRLLTLCVVPLLSVVVLVFVVIFRLTHDGDSLVLFDHHVMRSSAIALGTLLVCLTTGLVLGAARGSRLALALLVLFTIVDAGLYSLRHKASKSMPDIMASIPLPPGDNTNRIEPDIVPYTMNQVALHGYRNVTGYLNLFPEGHLDFAYPVPMQLAGVQWREARWGTSAELHNAKEAGESWIELDNPMPRLRLVNEALVSADPMADLDQINVKKTALVFEALRLDPDASGSLEVFEDTPGRITLTTNTTGTQLLVCSENYHPGWQLHIDDEAAVVVPTYGDFLGAVVPPGEHQISFSFWPAELTRGLIIMACALLLSALYLLGITYVGHRLRQRRSVEA